MKENWRPISGHERLYEISDMGRVRSLAARGRWPAGRMVGRANAKGYRRVTLHGPRGVSEQLVHRLVLEAFVGPCPPGMESSHDNDIPGDNRLENLAWKTHADNIAIRTMLGGDTVGERHGNAVLTDEAVMEIRKLLAGTDLLVEQIADRFGVSGSTVTHLNMGLSWGHVPWAAGFPIRTKGVMYEGNQNGAVLSAPDVLDIRQLLRATKLKQSEIAELYGVSRPAVALINTGKRWGNLPDSKNIPGAGTFPCRRKGLLQRAENVTN